MKTKVLTVLIPEFGPITDFYGLEDLKTLDLKMIIECLDSVIRHRESNTKAPYKIGDCGRSECRGFSQQVNHTFCRRCQKELTATKEE